MFTVKVLTHIETDEGEGDEILIGEVTGVKLVRTEPKNKNFDPAMGLHLDHRDGSRSHWSHGRFYVMNDKGSTVGVYALNNGEAYTRIAV